MTHKRHIKVLLRLHKEHKLIKETWDEYNVYFWLLSGGAIIGIYLKLSGIFAYFFVITLLWTIGTLRHSVRKHIRKHLNHEHVKK